jgi:predicted ribosomally synthesized peptide with SipW-like signal peptide
MSATSRRTLLLIVLTAACLTMSGATSSLALFSSRANVPATFASGTWSYYLHNNPTPPTANTTAQVNLTATTTAPTATTLRRYDTNAGCANRAGRGLIVAAPNPLQASACYYANWRIPVLAAPLTLQGTVTLDIWSATNTNTNGVTGALIVYLRDYDPTRLTYSEITNATFSRAYTRRTWIHTPITVNISGTRTLAVGHQLEIKIEAPSPATATNMLVAYDTTTYAAFVRVR